MVQEERVIIPIYPDSQDQLDGGIRLKYILKTVIEKLPLDLVKDWVPEESNL